MTKLLAALQRRFSKSNIRLSQNAQGQELVSRPPLKGLGRIVPFSGVGCHAASAHHQRARRFHSRRLGSDFQKSRAFVQTAQPFAQRRPRYNHSLLIVTARCLATMQRPNATCRAATHSVSSCMSRGIQPYDCPCRVFQRGLSGQKTNKPRRDILTVINPTCRGTSFRSQQCGQHADRLPLIGDRFILRRELPADTQAIFVCHQSRGCAQFFSTIPTTFRIPGRHFGQP
jgi:hypothetical protein